jgi:hypothetical protein
MIFATKQYIVGNNCKSKNLWIGLPLPSNQKQREWEESKDRKIN